MEVSKILKMDCSETEKLGMLFSGRMDAMNVMAEGCGAVTIKVWDDLFQDLIAWKNAPEKTTHNSDYAKCADEIQIYYEDHNDVYQSELIKVLKKHFAYS